MWSWQAEQWREGQATGWSASDEILQHQGCPILMAFLHTWTRFMILASAETTPWPLSILAMFFVRADHALGDQISRNENEQNWGKRVGSASRCLKGLGTEPPAWSISCHHHHSSYSGVGFLLGGQKVCVALPTVHIFSPKRKIPILLNL